MSRFSRYSRLSEWQLYTARIRRAWASFWLAWAVVGAVGALLAAVRLYYEPESCGLSGFWVAAREAAPRAQEPELAVHDTPVEWELPPVPELAVSIQPAEAEPVELAVEPEQRAPLFEMDEGWDMPQQSVRSVPGASRRVSPPPRRMKAAAASAAPAAAAEGEFTPAAYRIAPKPPYPALLRQSRVEGAVRLRIYLDAEGTPLRVEVATSSGYAEFDATARAWVMQRWRFSPARRGEQPVPTTVVTQVRFVLS